VCINARAQGCFSYTNGTPLVLQRSYLRFSLSKQSVRDVKDTRTEDELFDFAVGDACFAQLNVN